MKHKWLFRFAAIATPVVALASLSSCGEQNKCTITFEQGEHGTIVGSNTKEITKGTLWKDVSSKPLVLVDKDYALQYWTQNNIQVDPNKKFDINENVVASYKTLESSEYHSQTDATFISFEYGSSVSKFVSPNDFVQGTQPKLKSMSLYNEYTYSIDASLAGEYGIKYIWLAKGSGQLFPFDKYLTIVSAKYNGENILNTLEYKWWAGQDKAYVEFPTVYKTGTLQFTFKIQQSFTAMLAFELYNY